MAVLGDFTPLVQRISIDEAFLDVTGSVHLFGPPEAIGAAHPRRVRDEIGLPISVGAARTKHLAKIASQVAKPDGLVVVHPADERAFLDPLPVGLMWGIGPVTQQRLAERGIRTIGQLAGVAGRCAAVAARARRSATRSARSPPTTTGVGCRPTGRAGSVGAQSAFGRREPARARSRTVLGHLADRVAGRLRAEAAGRPHRHGAGPVRRHARRSRGRTPVPRPVSTPR